MKAYTYVLILLFTVIVCFVASFDHRIRFNRSFGAFIKSAILVAIPFIAWDIWFTYRGVWWFNTKYTLGVNIAGLPVEEYLFFICIPFSCIFTYHVLEPCFKPQKHDLLNHLIAFTGIILGSVVALLHLNKAYTFLTACVFVITLIYLYLIARVDWIGKASLVFIILMLGFFPVNGILTGTGLDSPIVNYHPAEFSGIRMGTIPVEDAVYGYTQFLLVLHFFKRFRKTKEETYA